MLGPKVNQAKLRDAIVEGEDNLIKFSLMLPLELVCGDEISEKIFPDEDYPLRIMNRSDS